MPGEAPEQNVGLARFTTLGVGGAARWFAHVSRVEDVTSVSGSQCQPVFVLGGGSNLVVADEGFQGLVLRMAIGGMTATPLENDDVMVTAGIPHLVVHPFAHARHLCHQRDAMRHGVAPHLVIGDPPIQ